METRRDEIRQTEISGTLADIWACNYHNGDPLTLRTSSVGVGFTLASSNGLVPDLTDNALMCCCGGLFSSGVPHPSAGTFPWTAAAPQHPGKFHLLEIHRVTKPCHERGWSSLWTLYSTRYASISAHRALVAVEPRELFSLWNIVPDTVAPCEVAIVGNRNTALALQIPYLTGCCCDLPCDLP